MAFHVEEEAGFPLRVGSEWYGLLVRGVENDLSRALRDRLREEAVSPGIPEGVDILHDLSLRVVEAGEGALKVRMSRPVTPREGHADESVSAHALLRLAHMTEVHGLSRLVVDGRGEEHGDGGEEESEFDDESLHGHCVSFLFVAFVSVLG